MSPQVRYRQRRTARLSGLLGLLLGIGGTESRTWAQNQGFALGSYDPPAAGQPALAVAQPYYSARPTWAAGLTLSYGHSPLVFGVRTPAGIFSAESPLIEHQLQGSAEVSVSFLQRVQLSLTLPLTLLETGTPRYDLTPVQGLAAGDPRLGGTVRLLGRPGVSTLQLSLGLDLWLPLSHLTDPPAFAEQVGETTVRFAPKLLLTAHTRLLQAALTTGFYYRPEARLGFTTPIPGAEGADFGNGMGSQLQAGLSLLLSVRKLRLQVGPEATFATVLTGGRAFSRDYTGLTLLLGLHHRVKDTVLVSLGGGLGLLRQAGIPDGQALLRLAYAPRPRATDFGEPRALPQATSPVLLDQDSDGIPDEDDRCPQQPDGLSPDPQRPGCPLIDQDHDGVADRTDLCPQRPAGPTPDPQRPGCPAPPPIPPPQLLLPQPLPAERPEPPPEPLLFDEPPAPSTGTAVSTDTAAASPKAKASRKRPRAPKKKR